MRKNLIFNKDRWYNGEDILKFSVLTFHKQRIGGDNSKIHGSEKIFLTEFFSAPSTVPKNA